ncbi:metallophosphoesterase [Deltaproteobacteria bacterium]|nr:metallophosphoesterase [Deltaproteobacteria bacterium]
MNRLPSFIIFFTTFLTIYGLLHFYFYRKVIKAFDMGMVCHLSLIIVLCFLLLSPVIINVSKDTGSSLPANIMAYVGYIWMAVLFLFFSINILIDFYRVIVHVSVRIFSAGFLRYIPEDRITFIIVIIIIAAIHLYGWFEAGNITVESISLNTSKIPLKMERLRVVQISDTHFNPINGTRLARRIESIVKELEPDIMVSTGDLIDRSFSDMESIAGYLRGLPAPYGKFATTGNHEFIGGIEEITGFTEKAGFKMLRNESVKVGDFLNIAAIDDPSVIRFGSGPLVSEDIVLDPLSPDRLNIFLKHQPRIVSNSIGKFDIQLSGHTHKGQIFPFTLVVSLFYPYLDGLFHLGNDSCLYVSRGTGTWGPPIRFLTFPEITVIDFYHSKD